MHLCMLFATLGGVCFGEVSVHLPNSNTTTSFPSLQARFGPNLPQGGLVGLLHLADPITACNSTRPPPERNRTYIALIERGEHCEFGAKVKNAQLAGYAAAIVYDNIADDPLRPMDSNLGDISIPSVFVTKGAGLFMASAPEGTTVTLYRDQKPQWPAFVITGLAVFLTVVCMICIFIYTRRRARMSSRAGPGALLLTQKEFSRLPTRRLAVNSDADTCCICLEEYTPGALLVDLPCKHAFHKDCIAPWLLNRRRTCPICKRDPFPGEHTRLLSEPA
eukprot:m.191114 g.191114  ORF g.191114 m.191114 type:complete len:277 (+) comp10591_c2_seq4:2653-3483(+)